MSHKHCSPKPDQRTVTWPLLVQIIALGALRTGARASS
jgi:hypothetical protein